MKSHLMKQVPMKESSGKISTGHLRKGDPAPSSIRTKRHSHSIPKPESRSESSKPLSTRKSTTEKRVAWSKTPTDREHDNGQANDSREGNTKSIPKSTADYNQTSSIRPPSNGQYAPNTDNAKLGKNRSLFSIFKKKKCQDEHDEPSWQDCIQIVPAVDEMNDRGKGNGRGSKTRSNLPEVRDDADRIDRSAVDRDASRHQNGKTTNQKDGSDDESRHSNMEFSTGDFSDLSFPAVGDASLEKRLSTVLNGTLGIPEDQKQAGFQHLLSVSMTKSPDKKKGETARKGIVPWLKQRSEETKEVPEKVNDETKSQSLETKQTVVPVALKEENTTKWSTISHYVPQSPPLHTSAKPLAMESPSRNRSVPICEDNPSVPDSPRDPSTEGTHIDPSNEDIVDSTSENRQHGDGYCLESFSPPVCDAPSFTFLPEDDNVDVPVDCDFAAGLAAALNFLTAPLFAYVFGESSTKASHQNRTTEQEKKVLMDIVTSDVASKEEKEKALSRLCDLIENQEMSIDELPDVIYRNSFDSGVTGESGTSDIADDATSVTKSLEPSFGELVASRLERPERSERHDRYTPLVAHEKKSLTPSRDDEHEVVTVEENAVREANPEPKGDSPPASTSLSSTELKILKKHAQILGIDVNVLINVKDEGQETSCRF